MLGGSSVNTGDPASVVAAEDRVREIQTKLHCWATSEPHRAFGDLFNLVGDPAFLLVAWDRVRGNKGAGTAGVDGQTAYYIEAVRGVEGFLQDLREDVKAGTFRPLPVRERMIPKPGTSKKRRLGIPVVRDRVVQAALKLVLEPIFEADFRPCSYGFRPMRSTHDAVAEVRFLTSKKFEWIVEGDIKACFDEISHPALMDRIRVRVSDKRVLALVKAFCKAGVLTEGRQLRDTNMGTPQGGILSPLLSNIALSVLDDYIAGIPGGPATTPAIRAKRRRLGLPNFRLVRYADDWALVIQGTREHAAQFKADIADVLTRVGLRLSEEKTLVTHIDEGIDFLGWRIQRHRKKGEDKYYVYTYPARKSLRSICAKVKAWCRQSTDMDLTALILKLNQMVKGWCVHFRSGVSSKTFNYLSSFMWWRVIRWIRWKYAGITWRELRRRFCGGGWWPATDEIALFHPTRISTTRYRYRGAVIPSPWPVTRGEKSYA